MSEKAARTDEESTQEIDVDALRRSRHDSMPPEDALPDSAGDELALTQAVPAARGRTPAVESSAWGEAAERDEPETAPPFRAAHAHASDSGAGADDDSVSVVLEVDDHLDALEIVSRRDPSPPSPHPPPRGTAAGERGPRPRYDLTPSTGILPSPDDHSVAEALRAMMDTSSPRREEDAYASLDEGETQTRLPDGFAEALDAMSQRAPDIHERPLGESDETARRDPIDGEALPSFALDEPAASARLQAIFDGSLGEPVSERHDVPPTRRAQGSATDERDGREEIPTVRRDVPSSTMLAAAGLPYTPRAPGTPPRGRGSESTAVANVSVPTLSRPTKGAVARSGTEFDATRTEEGPAAPLFSSSSVPHVGGLDLSPPRARPTDPGALGSDVVPRSATVMAPDLYTREAHERETRRSFDSEDDEGDQPPTHDTMEGTVTNFLPLARTSTPHVHHDADDDLPRFSLAMSEAASRLALDRDDDASSLPPADVEASSRDRELLEYEEIVQEDVLSDEAPSLPKQTTFHPPVSAQAAQPTPAFRLSPDAEERALLDGRDFAALVALYRQRLEATKTPNKRAALLLKLASVYEVGQDDPNEAFQTLVEAFELAPSNEDVVREIDRVGKETGRIGELATRVKALVATAPDDRRAAYLGHLVYWYERVLGRGGEVAPLVADIERHDRVHPIVLKRAAQIAAMNDDPKTQREHLMRALERTVRREEKVALHLALSSAYAGTPDALRHYELALEVDPTSIVALQGVKRLGKEKEQYAQVQWALERQAEVAPTESEKVDALLELAELQETKFLKRELAAELFERVVELEPSQPAALRGLERCYHALRDWPKLARVFTLRSQHTFDDSQKVKLLTLAAEVQESKMGDLPAAIATYTKLIAVDPKHRRALGDLARLHEKCSDWSNVATYRARLAELAPTKRASSQELVKLGDLLRAQDRDPELGKRQYERAVEIDPSNVAAWEVLQRLAVTEDDTDRVIECLEMRRKHTEVPRQRALVLVELANLHLERGDEGAAQACFEDAIVADPSNEAAAVAMLDHYTASERWAEAAPLCELLVNAAVRDRDTEALFIRLRLATRIAAALGDADRATTSALAALEARPKDSGAKADLIAVCAQSPSSRKRAIETLTRIADDAEDLSLDVVVRLGALMRDAGVLESAAALLERARVLEPDSRAVAKDLSDVYLLQGDFPRACKLLVDLARTAFTTDERFALLVETGEIWARRAEEHEKAASIFEEARAIKPRDPWLLQTLMWLYGELAEWDALSEILEEIVQIHEKPADKLKTLVAMAEVVKDKLGDRVRAAELFDEALDIDKSRLDLFEHVVRALTEEKDWERLERSYRRMIARVKDDDASQLKFLLFHQLGLIYRDRLGDASRAYDSLDAAARLRPDDAEVRRIVVELLVVTDNLDNAVTRLREAIDRDAHDPDLYAELYEIFLRQHAYDKAWCTVNVLARLREPTTEQRRFHQDYPAMTLDRVPGQIVEQAWHSHVFHADLEDPLTRLFTLMTPAVARLRFGQLRPEQRVGRPFTPTHSRMHDEIRTTFDNAAEILALTAPELLLGDPKASTPFAPALAPYGSISVSVPPVEAQRGTLVYLVGKRLAEQRPELAARAFFPSVPDLTTLLGTALRVSRNETAKDAAGAALDASFSATLTPEEREGIRAIVLQATSAGAALDVRRWSHAADLSSMRAGLLLCGDVEQARISIESDAGTASDLSTHLKVGELYRFATSDLYSDLRVAIGVAVQG